MEISVRGEVNASSMAVGLLKYKQGAFRLQILFFTFAFNPLC